MKVVIPDSRILEILDKILRFLQIRKAIDTILNHVKPLDIHQPKSQECTC